VVVPLKWIWYRFLYLPLRHAKPYLCHSFPRLMALSILPLSILLGVIGPWQIVLVVVVLLLLFGGKKIPELMRGLGQGMKEFKNAKDGDANEKKEEGK